MLAIKPWHRRVLLAVGAVVLAWRGWAWAGSIGQVEAASPKPAASAVRAAAPVPALDEAFSAMRMGLTELRQAATTGEPAMLQEAEKDILAGLLAALDASVVDGRVVPERYMRVVEAVAEVEGMFKYIPYVLEIEAGQGLPPIKLLLRRSPWPVIQSRPMAWEAAMVGGGVRLSPKRKE